jgi:hypothetical protein
VVAAAMIATGCSAGSSVAPTAVPTAISAPASASATAHQRLSPPHSGQPALTETFTSNLHGITASYPAGWVPRAAIRPWPAGEIVMQESEFADIIADGADENRFLALASQPRGDEAFDSWAARYLGIEDCDPAEPVTVGGARGISGISCPLALVEAGGRGYLIWLYGLDDLEWFKKILATVRLQPDAAIDTAPSRAP